MSSLSFHDEQLFVAIFKNLVNAVSSLCRCLRVKKECKKEKNPVNCVHIADHRQHEKISVSIFIVEYRCLLREKKYIFIVCIKIQVNFVCDIFSIFFSLFSIVQIANLIKFVSFNTKEKKRNIFVMRISISCH